MVGVKTLAASLVEFYKFFIIQNIKNSIVCFILINAFHGLKIHSFVFT